MRERPILMSGEMVRAILDGRKSQTRRVVKPQPYAEWCPVVELYHPTLVDRDGDEYPGAEVFGAADENEGRICPFGQPGDRLWVREGFTYSDCVIETDAVLLGREKPRRAPIYRATSILADSPNIRSWRPSIHMPRWASRITLEITGVRVERLCDMRESDAIAEGCPGQDMEHQDDWPTEPIEQFSTLWDSLNEKRGFGWDANPWVWVIEFRRAGGE